MKKDSHHKPASIEKMRISHIGKRKSPESIKNQSESLKEFYKTHQHWQKGVPRPQWVREKISKTEKGRPSPMKGRHHTEETKRKIGIAFKGKTGFKHSEENKEKMSLSANKKFQNGYIHPMKGKKHTRESKLKMSISQKKLYVEDKRKISKETQFKKGQKKLPHKIDCQCFFCTGKPPPWTGKTLEEIVGVERAKQIRLKQSERLKNEYKNGKRISPLKKLRNTPEFSQKIIKGIVKKPNKCEQKLINIINDNSLPYKYVGNGNFMVGNRCPDFINSNGSKKIIELFGRTYHSPRHSFFKISYNHTENGTKEYYKNFGYSCLVIWDYELKERAIVINKIKDYDEFEIRKLEKQVFASFLGAKP
jgi:hypothetical protein